MEKISPQILHQHWIHSHEEDSSDHDRNVASVQELRGVRGEEGNVEGQEE